MTSPNAEQPDDYGDDDEDDDHDDGDGRHVTDAAAVRAVTVTVGERRQRRRCV